MAVQKEAKHKEKFIRWFSDLNKDSGNIAGGKGANLAEMYNIGTPVPPGFVITAQSYDYFIEKAGLKNEIKELLEKIDYENTKQLDETTAKIRELIINSKIPKGMEEEIIEAYENLDVGEFDKHKGAALDILNSAAEPIFVAVRSSATTEDLESISEEEQILLKVDGKPIYDKIKNIYDKFGDCTNNEVEIPAMEENQIKWHRVQKLLKHSTKKNKLYKIKTITGREIIVSPNHTLIVLDESTLKPVVAGISEINIGTKLPVIGKIPEINNEKEIDITDYVKGIDVIEKDERVMIKNNSNNWSVQNGMPKKIEVSEGFAYFLGLYLAEGSTYKHQVYVTNSDYSLLRKCENFCRGIGIYKSSTINKHSIRINSPVFVRFLHETCGYPDKDKKGKGKLCNSKKIPNFVFGWSKKNIGTFLRGCFDGDGTVGKGGVSYCTTSPLLAGGILKLLEILGIGFTFNNQKNCVFKINILFGDIKKYSKTINFDNFNKQNKLMKFIEEYESKDKHFDFNYNLHVNSTLSNTIKRQIDASLPLKEIEIALCKECGNKAGQTSYYNGKKRYYCEKCNKSYYEKEINKRKINKFDYFDEKGRFKKEAKPWNYGKISGKISLPKFQKLSEKYQLKNIFHLFNGTIKWEGIKEISEVANKRPVYDFSVPKIENFAGGFGGIITHNSASFAGQQETYLNVKGKEQLLESIKKCFASLFTSRATYYRNKKGFVHEKSSLAVVIQKMIDANKSGVIFSKDPTFKSNSVIIEAVWGLGEGIVSGRITPDKYVLSPKLEIEEKTIANKKIAIVRSSSGKEEIIKLSEEKSKQQVLNDSEIRRLAEISLRLEEHYKKPQDIEFAIENREIYIVQTRPVTTIEKRVEKGAQKEIKGDVILKGLAASPGIAFGKVKIIEDLKDLSKISKGDILVTKMTNPDMVVTMQRSAGIITNEGGLTAHAAIVSREMGIPCIVGTQEATIRLKENEIITMDAYTGRIYKGKVAETERKDIQLVTAKTKTNIKVIVDLPSYAERASKTGIKKVGLTRIEGIIAESGKHPEYFLKQKKMHDYEEIIFNGVNDIAKYFEELWVRTSDVRTDEFQNLEGAPKGVEANPMLGLHGIRYGIKYPEILKAELRALKRVSERGKTIGLLLPQIISVDEVKKVKEHLKEIGFTKAKVGVMVETPAAVQVIKDLADEGIDFISFGTNDLTQYILAVDRGNEKVQHLYNEMNPAILYQLEFVIRVCKRKGVETSICGQSGSRKEMVKFLVEKGIDSISVNADVAKEISDYIAELEEKIVKGTDKEPRQYQPEKEIKSEKLTQDIQAIEKEKQEYLKKHPEEVPETNTEEVSETKEITEIPPFNPNEEDDGIPEIRGIDNLKKESGEIIEDINEAIDKIEKEKQEYLEKNPKEFESNMDKTRGERGLDIF